MEIHRSARRHGVREQDIRHAVVHAVVVVDLDPEADPPKVLEVIILTLAGDRLLAIHAMRLREKYHRLLGGADDG